MDLKNNAFEQERQDGWWIITNKIKNKYSILKNLLIIRKTLKWTKNIKTGQNSQLFDESFLQFKYLETRYFDRNL